MFNLFSRKNQKTGLSMEIEDLSGLVASEKQERSFSKKQKKTLIWRTKVVFWLLISSTLFLLIGRVFFLQVISFDHFRKISEGNRIKIIPIKAPRGLIKDRNGVILANNLPSFDLVFVPADLPSNQEDRNKIIRQVAILLEQDPQAIEAIFNEAKTDSKETYPLREKISHEKALILMEKISGLAGVYLQETALRDYPKKVFFSSILGYDGKITKEEMEKNSGYGLNDSIGKSGLELFYEKELKGKDGAIKVEVDSKGQIIKNLGTINPIIGNGLILNIDAELQQKSFEVLEGVLKDNPEAKGAAFVAIDPSNGAVRALVSVPSFDNNLFANGILAKDYQQLINDPLNPLLNRAISGQFPPGSTFKPLVAAAALEEGVINENTTVNCHGEISVGQWRFPDWNVHGITDVKKAIAESCNVFFYSAGGGWENIQGLGISRISRYARYFSLGDKTGIDLPSESKGNLPDEEWKLKTFGEKWYVGDDYHCSIGQGFVTATPLQMAVATAAIANGGKVYRPRLVDEIIYPDKKTKKIQSEILKENFISEKNIEIVRQGMRMTVQSSSGSGRLLQDLKVSSAGKTGTAQFGNDDKTHSWFVSFAPFDNPELATALIIESGGEGHDWALPATKEILKWYFEER